MDPRFHGATAHKGGAAELRAQARVAASQRSKGKGATSRADTGKGVKGKGATGRAVAAVAVYLTARDALQAAGILKPDYTVVEWEDYHFVAGDRSVFTVHSFGLFSSAKRVFIAGPREGRTETLTDEQVKEYRKKGDEKWGRYIPGSRLTNPRFIPGTDRKSAPFFIYDYGVPHKAGWIDENGVHRYPTPRPAQT